MNHTPYLLAITQQKIKNRVKIKTDERYTKQIDFHFAREDMGSVFTEYNQFVDKEGQRFKKKPSTEIRKWLQLNLHKKSLRPVKLQNVKQQEEQHKQKSKSQLNFAKKRFRSP